MINYIVYALIAVLAGLGVGSGGLLVIYMTIFQGIPQYEAQGINLMFFMFASAASLVVHFINKKINTKICLFICALGIPGSVVGTLIAAELNEVYLKKAFGVLLLLSGIFTMLSKNKKSQKNQSENQ